MRFGIHLPNSGALTAAADLVAIAVEAEALGFAHVWTYDHLINPVELSPATRAARPDYYNKADMPYFDALTTLGVVAGATRRIGLGTRVLLPVLRPPVALAKQLATLAVLAGEGRLVVGVGAGWLLDEFDAVGIDPAERFARLDEHVAVMRAAWSGGISEHDGRFYRHQAAGFHPVPSSPIPVLVGGSGDHTMRRVAGWADGWAMPNVEPGPEAAVQLAELGDKLLRACELEGRDPATVRVVTGAPIDAPPEHLALLREVGVDDVDLMLTRPEHLDMTLAGDFSRTTLQEFA
jgi:probable F420-dependent oxidoreductase